MYTGINISLHSFVSPISWLCLFLLLFSHPFMFHVNNCSYCTLFWSCCTPLFPNLLAGRRGWDGCDRGWIWGRHWYGEVLQHQMPLLRPGSQCGRPGGHHPSPQDAWGRSHCHCWGPFACWVCAGMWVSLSYWLLFQHYFFYFIWLVIQYFSNSVKCRYRIWTQMGFPDTNMINIPIFLR